jgi:hypothetical protein
MIALIEEGQKEGLTLQQIDVKQTAPPPTGQNVIPPPSSQPRPIGTYTNKYTLASFWLFNCPCGA